MKDELIDLICQIDSIKAFAHEEHVHGFFELDFVIYDVPEFITWKQALLFELQQIRKDEFVEQTITLLKKFNGFSDKNMFYKLSGALRAIQKNINSYFCEKCNNYTLNGGNIVNKKYQVFVSSTYKDLIDERLAVTQVLLENNCIPVGMEQFPASNMSQMEYIKMMLDDCDYYILISAGKYGSIDSDGKSYTEKEYDYAESKKIPIMSFVFSDICKLISDKCETSDDKKAKLECFRNRVSSGKVVKFYTDLGDLKSKVATSINHCIQDFPSAGWVRGSVGLAAKDLSVKTNMLSISATTKVYANEGNFGSFTFDYSNNNGEYTIGKDEYAFTTKWSKAGKSSIHAYKDRLGEGAIARIKGPTELQEELSGEFDFSSRVRTPEIGDIIVWKNSHNHYAATKIVAIKDDTHGSVNDELTCEFVIYV